jgi:Transmembrane family 220, helix
MRFVHAALLAMLILFAALQYNDPDWYYWGPVYLLAAAWSLLAMRQPERFVTWTVARVGAPISLALFLVGFGSLASQLQPGWIHIEEARESLGYLICSATTAFSLWESRLRAGKSPARTAGQSQS